MRDDWIFERCREVENDPDGFVDVWARDHYKSTIITFAGIVQEVLKDPEITIGIFSHDRPAAKAFLKQVKLEFEENEHLQDMFPDVLWKKPKKQAPKWSEDDGIICRRKSNPKEATVEAWGVLEGLPTGKHFHLRVYDDIITESNVTTPELIKKTTTQWELSLHLGQRDGREWYIGTRYHHGDTYRVIIDRGVCKERRHAATKDGTFDGPPVFLTKEQWEKKKASSSKPTIAAQMLLNPLAGSETKFDPKWIKFWLVRPKRLNVYIMVDASKGKHAKSDFTAISVVGYDINRNKYLLDGWRHRMNLSRRWQLLRDTWRRWSNMPGIEYAVVGYEQFGMQTDIEYFEERMRIEGLVLPIEEVKWPRQGLKSKEHRIERMEPDFRMGRFRLPAVIKFDDEWQHTAIDPKRKKIAQEVIKAGEPWRVATPIHKKNEDGQLYDVMDGFMEEFKLFPFAPYDDFLDATSRIYDLDPQPPIFYSDEPGMRLSTEPEMFVDT